ncbi:hypothetical protein HDE_13110 [Halotydeus destructor]|nr:hypothetical protein HDE_13110 [Halotydeus destructor]
MSTNSPTLSLLDMASDSSFTSQDTIIMMTNALINGSNQVLGIDGDLLLTDGDSEAESVDTVLDIPGPPKVGDGKGATSSDSGLGRDDDASTVDSNSTLNSSEGHAPDVPPPPPVRSSVPTSMSVSEIRKAFERNLALSNASTASIGSLSTSGSGGPQGGQRPKSFPSQATPGKEGIGQAQIPANAGEALASLSVHEQLRWLASAEANSSTMANSSTGSGLGSNSNGSNRQQHSQHQQASLLGPQQAVVNCSNEQTNCSDSVSPSSSSSRTNNSGDVSSVSASLASGSKNWPSEDILIEYTSEPRTLVPSKRTSSVSNFYPLGQPTSSGPLQPQAGPPPPYSCVDPNVGQARFSPVYLSLNRRDPHQVLSLVNGAAIRPKHVQPNQGVGVAGPPGTARAQTPPQVPPRLIPAQLLSQLAAQGHRVVHVTQAGVPVSLGQQGKDPSGAGGQQRLTLVGQQQPLSQQHHQLLIQANSGQQSPKQGQQFRLVHPAHVTGNGEPIYVQHGQRLLITKGPMVNPETAGQVGQSPRHGPHATQAHFLGHHQGHPTIITQSNPNLRQSLQEFPNPSEIRRRDGLNAFPHVWEEPPKPGSLPVPPAGAALDRPNQAVRDELEQFVQLDNDRTERIKKRYSSAEDNSDDPTFGFGKRPQVRGIKTPIDPRQGQSHHGTLPRVIHIQHPAGNAPGGQPGVALTPGQQRRHVYLIQGGPQYQQRLVQVGATLPRHSHLHIIQQPGGQPFTGPAGQPVVQHIHLKPQQLQVVSHGGTGTDRPASSMGDAQAPPGGQPKPIYCYQHHHHGPPGTSGPPLGTQCVKGCPPGGVQGAPSQLTYKTFSMPNVAMIRPAGGGSLSLVPVHATLPKDERGAPEGASSSPKHQCSDPSYGTSSKAPKASVCLVNNKNGAGCNNNPDLVKDITGRASCSKGCPMSSSAHCQVSTAGPCPLAGPNSLSHMVAASVPSESKSTVSKKEKDKAATSKADKGKDKDKDKMGKKVEKEKKKKEKEAAKAAAKEAKSSSSSCSSSKNSSSGVSSTQSPSQQQEGVIYYSMNV